jgi:enamine deaminase RidA (YjgF/YER057c/UK114 family)
MERQRISSGAPLEGRVGYSRAVRVAQRVWVSGTAPIPPQGGEPPAGAYAQATLCFEIIAAALAQAGAGLDDVVRSRLYLARADDFAEVGRAHREALGETAPACTAVVVELLDPRWLVEIEVDALVGTTE